MGHFPPSITGVSWEPHRQPAPAARLGEGNCSPFRSRTEQAWRKALCNWHCEPASLLQICPAQQIQQPGASFLHLSTQTTRSQWSATELFTLRIRPECRNQGFVHLSYTVRWFGMTQGDPGQTLLLTAPSGLEGTVNIIPTAQPAPWVPALALCVSGYLLSFSTNQKVASSSEQKALTMWSLKSWSTL